MPFPFMETLQEVEKILRESPDAAAWKITERLEAMYYDLTAKQVAEIREKHNRGFSGARIGELLGISVSKVYKVINGGRQ